MKVFVKTVLCLILVFTVAFSFCKLYSSDYIQNVITDYVESDLPTDFSDRKPMSDYYYNKLDERQKQTYVCMFEGLLSHMDRVQIPSVSHEDVETVFQYISYDNPDIICLEGDCLFVTSGYKSYIDFKYVCSVEVCGRMTEKLIATSEKVLKNIEQYETDYEKELFIHDYIVNNCSYAKSNVSHTAYGCLVDRRAVCSGYAYAFMYLMNKAGIDTVVIPGTANSAGESAAHLWNMTELDGEKYFVDTTWDDPDFEKSNTISHLYFNVTDSFIAMTHTEKNGNMTECRGRRYNYFEYSNLVYQSYDSDTVDAIIENSVSCVDSGSKTVEFMFSSEEAYNEAVDSLFNTESMSEDLGKILYYVDSASDTGIDTHNVMYVTVPEALFVRLIFK